MTRSRMFLELAPQLHGMGAKNGKTLKVYLWRLILLLAASLTVCLVITNQLGENYFDIQ